MVLDVTPCSRGTGSLDTRTGELEAEVLTRAGDAGGGRGSGGCRAHRLGVLIVRRRFVGCADLYDVGFIVERGIIHDRSVQRRRGTGGRLRSDLPRDDRRPLSGPVATPRR